MVNARKERLRTLLLKRKFLSGRRKVVKFLEDKTSVNNYFKERISGYNDLPAVTDTYTNVYLTFAEVEEQMSAFAAALQSFGIQKGDFVDIFTENNGRWCVCEQGAMRTGAVCALRF